MFLKFGRCVIVLQWLLILWDKRRVLYVIRVQYGHSQGQLFGQYGFSIVIETGPETTQNQFVLNSFLKDSPGSSSPTGFDSQTVRLYRRFNI